ncbi:MAG: ATP-binding protein [Planctomycetes bacterium]|nr:ATP-binding protein [Planctomycetota bacterium]
MGPRQCGKTTLAKQLGGIYFDLEQPSSQLELDIRWDELVAGDELIILDEAQEAPDLFARLRGAIDLDRKRNGRFLLLGSVSPNLITGISESLAGRLASLELSPFLLPELPDGKLDELWLYGGYPDGGVLNSESFGAWQESYLQLLCQRDLPRWGLPAKPRTTERLLHMLVATQGQALNASKLGSALSLDHKTVTSYIEFLEGAYLVRRLDPFHVNIKKRLVKSPRILWRDSGLMHAMQGIKERDQLFLQPWVGHGWESFVIEQTLSTLAALGKSVRPFWFRTSDGFELDLVLDWGTERWAIEIKLTSDPSPSDLQRLDKTADMIEASQRILICRVQQPMEGKNSLVTNLSDWTKRLLAI